eukprot:3536411-Prymnesium_polylepis.1
MAGEQGFTGWSSRSKLPQAPQVVGGAAAPRGAAAALQACAAADVDGLALGSAVGCDARGYGRCEIHNRHHRGRRAPAERPSIGDTAVMQVLYISVCNTGRFGGEERCLARCRGGVIMVMHFNFTRRSRDRCELL